MSTLAAVITAPEPRTAEAVVLPLARSMCTEQSLREAYDAYRAVVDPVTPDTTTTHEVLVARIALTVALLADGWQAPPEVLARLRLDEELLAGEVLTAC